MTKDFDARNEKKSRSVCAAMAESADTDKRALSERERRILDMWPRYEDGEPVWFGDGAAVNVGNIAIEAIEFTDGCAYVKDGACGDYNTLVQVFKHVKRPAPEVLDADGVRIREGDTVWIIPAVTDTPDEPHEVKHINRWGEVLLEFHFERSTGVKGEYLTHTRPDSWERLEEEADKDVVDYWGCAGRSCYACPAMIDGQTPSDRYGCMSCKIAERLDIIRRAKKLAGVER